MLKTKQVKKRVRKIVEQDEVQYVEGAIFDNEPEIFKITVARTEDNKTPIPKDTPIATSRNSNLTLTTTITPSPQFSYQECYISDEVSDTKSVISHTRSQSGAPMMQPI